MPGDLRLAASASLAALILLFPAPAPGASFPPSFHFRTLSTPRVVVHFHQGLEPLARQAASLAAEILAAHEARYHNAVGRVHIVIADNDDTPNGFATPLPYPLVHIRAAAPDGTDDFGNYEGWLRLVLTHELAHIVHLDEAHSLVRAGRKVFGRAPFLFPNGLTPTWMIEGLATYEETQGTAFGRGRNPDTRMVLRMAALEGRFPAEDRPAVSPDIWPQGDFPYFFGEAFLRDLSDRYGPETLPELGRVHSGRIVPFVDDLTAHRVTGASFHAQWREWAEHVSAAFEAEAERIGSRGLTVSRPVTERGVRQDGPRFSPDGAWIAYTSRTLTRYRAIRLVRPDGTADRWLANRNGGTSLSWTADGKALVFDEPEIQGVFAAYSDLRVVDVKSGRVRRLTRGLRASDPDVSGDGRVAFVRRFPDRSELWLVGVDGEGLRALTESAPGTEWSGPHWSLDGTRLVAARWIAGGWLDLVLVDPARGSVTALTEDRARDMEPTWTPDGTHVVFRSDRDGVSNLYALRLADRALLRLSNVLGGAFSPSLSPDGLSVAFADYSSRGYDVRVFEPQWGSLPEADAFVDSYPTPRPLPEPAAVEAKPYRPLPAMLPRFWSPYAASVSGEWRYGVVTAGTDPLFRHAYGLDVHRGVDTDRTSVQGFYQYDRFRPTLLVTAEDRKELDLGEVMHTREIALRATLPLALSLRTSQSLSLAWRRRREILGPADAGLDFGGLELAWTLSSTRQYPFSISPVEGWRLRMACLKEAPALGSDVSLAKVTADVRAYTRLFGETDALALRAGGGATLGRPSFQTSYAVGGFPDGALFDVVRTNLSVLRGYPDDAFRGRSFAHANLEYRFPLAHPQRGYRLLPVFLRHVHAAVFADAAHAWSGPFHLDEVKTGAGVALAADTILGHGLPLTASVGVARGFAAQGETRVYFRAGLAF